MHECQWGAGVCKGGELLASVQDGAVHPTEPNLSAALPKAWGAARIFPNAGGMPTAFSVVASCILILR